MADDGLVLNLSYNEPVQAQWPAAKQQRRAPQQRKPAQQQPRPAPQQQQSTQHQPKAPASHPGPSSASKEVSHQASKRAPGPEKQQTDKPAGSGAGAQGAASKAGHRGPGPARDNGAKTKRQQQQQQWSGKARSYGKPAAAGADGGDDAEAAMRGADDDEDGDVAAMVAAVSQRDKQLEQDLSKSTKHQRHTAGAHSDVVEFGDVDDDAQDGGHAAKRHRSANKPQQQQQQQQQGGAGRRPGDKDKAQDAQQQAPARHVPGELAHVDQQPGAASAQIFGSDLTNWEGVGLDARFIEQLRASNFEKPTKVQQEAIPVLLAGKDALVKAPTGSGKTLAYLIPMINYLQAQNPRLSRAEGTYGIVIAPTRELCIQIQDVADALLRRRFCWIVTSLLIGGEHRGHEKARLRKGVTIVMATPGRLEDHLKQTACFKTSELRWLVLDEADRLLDLGFEAKLREIIELLDKKSGMTAPKHPADPGAADDRRRTVLLSATLHQGLGALATEIQKDPVPVGFTVKRGPSGLHVSDAPDAAGDGSLAAALDRLGPASGQSEFSIPSQLRQAFVEVPCKERLMALAGILRQKLLMKKLPVVKPGPIGPERAAKGKAAAAAAAASSSSDKVTGRKVVVFISCCDGVELLHGLLGGFWTDACGAPLLEAPLLRLHGDMPQSERTSAFMKFNQAKSAVLLCTDVAARGLDFPDVSTIVQYDVPGAPEEYVHRVGRTARMGHGGEAVLLLMPHERPYVDLLAQRGISLQEDSMLQALKWLPPPPEKEMRQMSRSAGRSQDGSAGTTALACALQRAVLQAVAANPEVTELASNAFRSFVRAYATHPRDVKKIFNVRQLHLGHVAFSYGLKDTPVMIGSSGSSAERKRKKHESSAAAQKQAKKKLYTSAQRTAGQHNLPSSSGPNPKAGAAKPNAAKPVGSS